MEKNNNSFRKYLILSYYREFSENSSFIDLARILGLSFKDLDELIISCIKSEYLFYNSDDLLLLTDNGEVFLRKASQHKIYFSNVDFTSDLFTVEPMPLDEIYIPDSFTNK